MKIVAFVVRCTCGNCDGQKWVPGGQRQYGEVVKCPLCDGTGTVDTPLPFEDFKRLVQGMVWDAPVEPPVSPTRGG